MNSNKLFDIDTLKERVAAWKNTGKKIVFTNGCFDVFHAGHAYILNTAKSFGDVLIVGLNSDTSITKLKGDSRPINEATNRIYVLNSMQAVDAIVLFEDETPIKLIQEILPNVLVKGGDYTEQNIVGATDVIANGGKVEIVPLLEGLSSTEIIAKHKNNHI